MKNRIFLGFRPCLMVKVSEWPVLGIQTYSNR